MTLMVRDFKDDKIEITENSISIKVKSDDKEYSTLINLFADVVPADSKTNILGF